MIINNGDLVNLFYYIHLHIHVYDTCIHIYTHTYKKKIPILYLKHILLKSFCLTEAFSLLVGIEEVKNRQKSKNFAQFDF